MFGPGEDGSTQPELPRHLMVEVDRIREDSSAPGEELARICAKWPEFESAIYGWFDSRKGVGRVDAVSSSKVGLIEPGVVVEGRYEIRQRLGRGAMGEVWYAVDRRWDHRPHALKFLKESPLRALQHRLMIQEADVLASLAHENIVAVRTVGRHGARPFLGASGFRVGS